MLQEGKTMSSKCLRPDHESLVDDGLANDGDGVSRRAAMQLTV